MIDYLPEGAKVAYSGSFNRDNLTLGDEGKILMSDGQAVHVLMHTGARKDSVVLLPVEDVSLVSTARSSIEDSLYDGTLDGISTLTTVAVRNVYDRTGEGGLINALASSGELPDLENEAEKAIIGLAQVVRSNPVVQSVLSHLDEDEGDSFVNRLALAAIDDVLGS